MLGTKPLTVQIAIIIIGNYPAVSTIATDLKMSKSTVKRALGDLEKAKYLHHERRYRQSG